MLRERADRGRLQPDRAPSVSVEELGNIVAHVLVRVEFQAAAHVLHSLGIEAVGVLPRPRRREYGRGDACQGRRKGA